MGSPVEISTSEMRNFIVRRLGEKEADEVMGYIDAEVQKQLVQKTDNIRTEINQWRNELKNVFATKEDAVKLQNKLVKKSFGS